MTILGGAPAGALLECRRPPAGLVELTGADDGRSPLGADAPPLAARSPKMWCTGRVLRVGAVGGTPVVRARVHRVAAEWTARADLSLEFVGVGRHAEIRVAFDAGASWSELGRDALWVPDDLPTMNLGALTADTPDGELRRVVLHQFGHALGLRHDATPTMRLGDAAPGLVAADHAAAARCYPGPSSPTVHALLRSCDGREEIDAVVGHGTLPRGRTGFALNAAPEVTRWKAVDVPVGATGHERVEVGGAAVLATAALDRSRPLRFWRGEAFGVRTQLRETWDVLPAVPDRSSVLLTWARDHPAT